MATEKRLIDANAYVDELKWLQAQVSSASAIEIQEYIDRTNRQPTVNAVEVVYCDSCVNHGYCLAEDVFRMARAEKPYCCAGKKEGEMNA